MPRAASSPFALRSNSRDFTRRPVRAVRAEIAGAEQPHRHGPDDALVLAGRRADASDVAAYYRRRAEGGVGLILSEGTVIDRPVSRNDPRHPVLPRRRALAGWKARDRRGACRGRRDGAAALARRRGREPDASWAPDGAGRKPVGPVAPGKPRGVPMSDEDIADAHRRLRHAPRPSQAAGFRRASSCTARTAI